MDITAPLVPDAQAAETTHLAEHSFDYPAPFAQVLVQCDAALGNPHSDAALTQPNAVATVVEASIAMQFRGVVAGPTRETGNRSQRGDQRLQHARIMEIRSRDLRLQWNAPLVEDHVLLAAEFAAIGWVRSRIAAPGGGWHVGQVDISALAFDLAGFAQSVEHGLMQFLLDAGLRKIPAGNIPTGCRCTARRG